MGILDGVKDTQRCLDVRIADLGQDMGAQGVHRLFGAFGKALASLGEPQGLGAAVTGVVPTHHEPGIAQSIQETNERGALNSDMRGEGDLPHPTTQTLQPNQRCSAGLRDAGSNKRRLSQSPPLTTRLQEVGRQTLLLYLHIVHCTMIRYELIRIQTLLSIASGVRAVCLTAGRAWRKNERDRLAGGSDDRSFA